MASYYTQTREGQSYAERPPGKCWLIDGTIYYSPNCTRSPPHPPPVDNPLVFNSATSQVRDFEEPCWWKESSEWLGFVPRRPVMYSGAWFDGLSHIPRQPTKLSNYEYTLYGPVCQRWTDAEKLLVELINILREHFQLKFDEPFPPSDLGYNRTHGTAEEARLYILRGRDWFAMLLGLLFWMTRKIREPDDFIEGLVPPSWLKKVIVVHSMHAAVDSVRLTPLLNRNWEVDRVGLWLHNPNRRPSQPPAAWFMEQGVPVWYRWTNVEISCANKIAKYGLMAPRSEELQAIVTWIDRSIIPHPPAHYSYTETDSSFNESASFFDNDFLQPDFPVPATPYHTTTPQPTHRSSTTSPPRSRASRPSAKTFWAPHFEKHRKLHKKMETKESDTEKQRRLARAQNPSIKKARVYVWDWNDNNEFVRELVLKSNNEDTLTDYSGPQKRFDAYCNEWNCCSLWGQSTENEGLIELPSGPQDATPEEHPDPANQGPRSPSPILISPHSPAPAPSTSISAPPSPQVPMNDIAHIVVGILRSYHGFVPPTPLPSHQGSVPTNDQQADARLMLKFLGETRFFGENPFFASPLGRICVMFTKSLMSPQQGPPKEDLWDLGPNNRDTLNFGPRLSSVRLLKRGENIVYMIDLGNEATVPWSLAVVSPASLFYICRLPNDLCEEEIAMDLLRNGVPFRTVQSRETLAAVTATPISAFVPIRLSGHIFTRADFQGYEEECHRLFRHPRSRAALMRGGYIGRIASMEIGIGEALSGPSGLYAKPAEMFIAADKFGHEYVDDDLTFEELEILCGAYNQYTGGRDLATARKSWFPSVSFEGSGEDFGHWTPRNESEWLKRVNMINQGNAAPVLGVKWRDQMRGIGPMRRAKKYQEELYAKFITEQVGVW